MDSEIEVRLLLDPKKVLTPDSKLKSSVQSDLGLKKEPRKLNVQFLDKTSLELYNAGWSARIRYTEGGPAFELTYKKRYAIASEQQIDATLNEASNQGFEFGANGRWEAQIEWGYESFTLSISYKIQEDGTALPKEAESRQILIENAPLEFDNWNSDRWGTRTLGDSRIFGPVPVKRYVGSWEGMRLYLEVWPIRDRAGRDIVEASFKTESRETASKKKIKLMELLQSANCFLAEDSAKTQLIMENY
ncbi:hypothetical protein BO82DRAFT_1989 [Aspergillus uvarum CBS 121591]|uniref:CYTH domain-containing protein n=1 Tax=Aspergillus uvarum CBS 121591 TaxID=1448315 RepID=A0A319CQY2_9EURO|nr:hypothetical protein BO82DRAFT_1989 [Aspergillus uvarum CBS 121591]PYH87060.1 hypothetical protein BO82DRAFT_1989 [Aspergillus uvarum CBS 121591]